MMVSIELPTHRARNGGATRPRPTALGRRDALQKSVRAFESQFGSYVPKRSQFGSYVRMFCSITLTKQY